MAVIKRATEEKIRKPVGASRKRAGTTVESETGQVRGEGGKFVSRTEAAKAKRPVAKVKQLATKATEPVVDEAGEAAELKPLTEAGKLRLINMLLAQAEQAAKTGEFKVTTNDLIRLLQIQREMEPQRHKQVTVRWVEDEAA